MPSIAAGGTIMNMSTQDPLRPLPPLAPEPPDRTMLPAPVRWLLLALAVVCLALAIVGIFLPVLPTVPFVLLAAWAASLSSTARCGSPARQMGSDYRHGRERHCLAGAAARPLGRAAGGGLHGLHTGLAVAQT